VWCRSALAAAEVQRHDVDDQQVVRFDHADDLQLDPSVVWSYPLTSLGGVPVAGVTRGSTFSST
jgi:hypothetical protein